MSSSRRHDHPNRHQRQTHFAKMAVTTTKIINLWITILLQSIVTTYAFSRGAFNNRSSFVVRNEHRNVAKRTAGTPRKGELCMNFQDGKATKPTVLVGVSGAGKELSRLANTVIGASETVEI